MADLNTVTLSGNLTKDPELKTLPSGKQVANLRLGVKLFGADKSLFIDVTAWEKLAVIVSEAFSQGQKVTFTGRLDYREWDTNDGQKRSAISAVMVDVVLPKREQRPAAEDIEF